MSTVEGICLWAAILGYIFAFVAVLAGLVFKKEPWQKMGWSLIIVAAGLHFSAIAFRWVATGHMPVMGVYENSLLGAWFVVLIYLFTARRIARSKPVAVVLIPVVLLMLGNGIMGGAQLEPLAPPFQSNWLFVHVIFAWFAYGSFFVAACIGVTYLWKDRRRAAGETDMASLGILDNLTFRFLMFGFIADTIMIATGSIWANGLWGRYWGWDPIETWSLISWIIYGVALHLRITMGWKNRRMALLAVGSVVTVAITFFGIGFISGVHTQLL